MRRFHNFVGNNPDSVLAQAEMFLADHPDLKVLHMTQSEVFDSLEEDPSLRFWFHLTLLCEEMSSASA